jgi:hypothetical protein
MSHFPPESIHYLLRGIDGHPHGRLERRRQSNAYRYADMTATRSRQIQMRPVVSRSRFLTFDNQTLPKA